MMIADDDRMEWNHEYEIRLGMMGLCPNDIPTAEQHDHAVATADAHIAALKLANRDDAIAPLIAMIESL
jgi:hypothetical protein